MGHCRHKHHRHHRRHHRHHRRLRGGSGATAIVNNAPRMGASSGLVNIPIQIPINLGDALAFNRSNGNSTTNVL